MLIWGKNQVYERNGFLTFTILSHIEEGRFEFCSNKITPLNSFLMNAHLARKSKNRTKQKKSLLSLKWLIHSPDTSMEQHILGPLKTGKSFKEKIVTSAKGWVYSHGWVCQGSSWSRGQLDFFNIILNSFTIVPVASNRATSLYPIK